MDPLAYWRAADVPDRQGITEIRYVTGLLAYWDELRRRRPDMLIDTCASGGRRNDLETLRRAVPLWRSDYAFEPVRRIAESATTGHATTIITGLAVGLESVVAPVLTVGVAVVASYHLGRTSGVGATSGDPAAAARAAGLFGTAVATMGMLASAVYVLAMNNFGPIADNAGGIAEMSRPVHQSNGRGRSRFGQCTRHTG